MKCPRCRGNAPDGASFCPNCGNDLRLFQQSPAQKQQVPVKEQMRKVAAATPAGYFQPQAAAASAIPLPQKKSKLGWILGAVGALLLLVSGFFVMSMLAKNAKLDPSNMLGKNGAMGGPMLQKTGSEAPMLGQTARNPAAMPDDVLRWLQHLERIEKQRGKLAREGLSNLMVMAQSAQFGTDMEGLRNLATGDPDAPEPKTAPDKIAESNVNTKQQWADLRRDFDSYPPPAECQTIADSYGHALDETGAMITDVNDAIVQSKDDPNAALKKLYGMQNTSKSIDEYGNATDDKVKAICDKYNKRKWFSISSDFGNTSIFQSLGGIH